MKCTVSKLGYNGGNLKRLATSQWSLLLIGLVLCSVWPHLETGGAVEQGRAEVDFRPASILGYRPGEIFNPEVTVVPGLKWTRVNRFTHSHLRPSQGLSLFDGRDGEGISSVAVVVGEDDRIKMFSLPNGSDIPFVTRHGQPVTVSLLAQLGPALLGLSPGPENEPWWKYVAVDQNWIVVVDYHHDSPLGLSFLSIKDCQTQVLEQAPK